MEITVQEQARIDRQRAHIAAALASGKGAEAALNLPSEFEFRSYPDDRAMLRLSWSWPAVKLRLHFWRGRVAYAFRRWSLTR